MNAATTLLFVFWCVLLLGMEGTMAKSPDDYRAKLQQVNLSDGASKEEAIVIAQNYLLRNAYKDGYKISRPRVNDSTIVKDCWAVVFPTTWSVKLGQGLKWLEVDVDKTTGEIKSVGWGPS